MPPLLRLHNTLSGADEPFVPIDAASGRVTFYTCGPTVYDYAHIGNFRAFLVADLLRRWLESPLCERAGAGGEPVGAYGYDVAHVMNITDVGHMTDDAALDGAGEDKMVAAQKRLQEAKKSGALPTGADLDAADPYAIADFYLAAFKEDALTLGLKVVKDAAADPSRLPRASGHVTQMLELIDTLLRKGAAYTTEGGACYFDIASFPEYGALSGNTLERLRAGAGGRVLGAHQSAKRHPADFLLWKHDPTHLMRWDPAKLLKRETPLKEGYPGWHVECSAMAQAILAPETGVIDIHSGGEDNIFPHHECEIAQSRQATGSDSFARCWVHTRHLFVEGAKMSKSAGNFYTLRDLTRKGFEPAAIRLELIKTHYRTNANFTEQGLIDSTRMVERWRRFVEAGDVGGEAGERDERALDDFTRAMNADLNAAGAIGAVNAWINRTSAPTRADADLMRVFDAVLGVLERTGAPSVEPAGEANGGGSGDAGVQALVDAREAARKAKNWAEADRLRGELASMGVEVKDSPSGPTWKRTARL